MRIEAKDDDSDRFIAMVRSVVEAVADRESPATLRVIRIDNWFGGRWRGFTSKMLGFFGVSRGRLVIPPFVPSRVESERSWKMRDSAYAPDAESGCLHRRIRSEENLRRYFDQYCPETLAVWFSSKSASNGRGSIMAYSDVGMSRTVSWYVELDGTRGWKPSVTSGITGPEFLDLLPSGGTRAV